MRAQDTTETVYHYTKKDTFVKHIFKTPEKPKGNSTEETIVGQPELRMYPVNQMNDPMECKWLIRQLLDNIQLMAHPKVSINKDGRAQLELINTMTSMFDNYLWRSLRYDTNYPTYLGSFTFTSGMEDGLPMWREYADQGTGVAIGLNKQALLDNYKSDKFFFSGQVCYDTLIKSSGTPYSQLAHEFGKFFTEIIALLLDTHSGKTIKNLKEVEEDVLNKLDSEKLSKIKVLINNIPQHKKLPTYDNIPKINNKKGPIGCANWEFVKHLNLATRFCKQGAYAPENEYRIVVYNTLGEAVYNQTRQKRQLPEELLDVVSLDQDSGKTYYPIPLILGKGQSLVREIIIGPNCILSAMDVKMILKECNPALANVAVRKSQIYMVKKY